MSFEDNDVHHKEQPFGGFEQVSTSASSAKEEFDPEQSKTVNTIQNRKRIKLEDMSIETHTCKTAESLSDDESFLDSQSQSLSQISSWSQENMETSLSDLNKGIDIISRGHSSPVKFQVRSDISSLKPSTKRTVKRKVVSAIDTVLNGIAPGQSQALFKMIQDKDPESANSSELQEIIVKIHQESTDRNTKQQLLSLIALSHTKKDLQQLIPGLTVYAINEARKHAKTNGHGAIIPKQLPVFRHRMDKDKLDHALDFFFSPSFHQVSSFGVKEMKLDNGNTVTIPEVVRTACHATLINVYTKFCTETEFLPLSRSTLFKILNACPSSRRTNLKGLDNCAADGGASYETLLTTVKEMGNYVVDEEVQVELRDCKDSLNASKIYLKTDFKAHLRKCDKCPDHCINYSLSDPTDQHLQQHCVDHQHDMVCERCNLLPQAVSTIKRRLSELDIPDEVRNDLLASIDVAEAKILEWKSHIVRGVNQDLARILLLEELKDGECLIIMDWAMKFLPLAFREKQSDWFGQKGVNWHVSVCIFKDENQNLMQRTYTHTMDAVKQDWVAVASVLEHTLRTIKIQLPRINTVYLRSDNAGCYHCGSLWLAIPKITETTGITIARYDYSEPQNGKSYCDAKIAHMRGKIRRSAASGSDVLTASDMKMAIDKHGGVTSCQAAYVAVDPNSLVKKITCPIKAITKISNVRFNNDDTITAWKAFEIGNGKKISINSTLNDVELNVDVHANFTIPTQPDGIIKKPTMPEQTDSESFNISCPEIGCILYFESYSDMHNHCLLGNHEHQDHKGSTFNDIKLRWKESCFNLTEDTIKFRCETGLKQGSNEQIMGWALKKERKVVRFSDNVKSYLSNIFEEGERSGIKANPLTVVRNMRVARDENGNKRFTPKEYLELGQIASFFSRLAVMQRCKTPIADIDQDLDAVILALNKADAVEQLL
ncbi:uncharacterized protein LOC143051543 [Mytilus galloprovincialis]|uniref:uncharacterized protein LOC143051543 n=1 Tax=Mytilus galloprovincialis TaxID=29158 RepID=UPI003F7C5CDE